MNMKMKIILLIFVLIVIGYGIYFVSKDVLKQSKLDSYEKKVHESYQDYDLRKFILNTVQSFDLKKKDKDALYEQFSSRIEKYKDMPLEKLEDKIKLAASEYMNTTKRLFSVKKNEVTAPAPAVALPMEESDIEEDNDDVEEINEEEDVVESFYAKNKNDKKKDDKKKDNKKDAKKPQNKRRDTFVDLNPAELPSNNKKFVDDKEIEKTIDETIGALNVFETNMKKIRSMVGDMADKCNLQHTMSTKEEQNKKAEKHQDFRNIDKELPNEPTKENGILSTLRALDPRKKEPEASIEGFENNSIRGYSFL